MPRWEYCMVGRGRSRDDNPWVNVKYFIAEPPGARSEVIADFRDNKVKAHLEREYGKHWKELRDDYSFLGMVIARLGLDGWELVSSSTVFYNATSLDRTNWATLAYYDSYLFKRPLQEE